MLKIYLLQYLNTSEKNETTFNIRLNNYGKYAKSEKPILACKHFSEPYRNFQQHAEFSLIEQIKKQATVEKTKKLLLKLKSLYSDGLNQDLNDTDWS